MSSHRSFATCDSFPNDWQDGYSFMGLSKRFFSISQIESAFPLRVRSPCLRRRLSRRVIDSEPEALDLELVGVLLLENLPDTTVLLAQKSDEVVSYELEEYQFRSIARSCIW